MISVSVLFKTTHVFLILFNSFWEASSVDSLETFASSLPGRSLILSSKLFSRLGVVRLMSPLLLIEQMPFGRDVTLNGCGSRSACISRLTIVAKSITGTCLADSRHAHLLMKSVRRRPPFLFILVVVVVVSTCIQNRVHHFSALRALPLSLFISKFVVALFLFFPSAPQLFNYVSLDYFR